MCGFSCLWFLIHLILQQCVRWANPLPSYCFVISLSFLQWCTLIIPSITAHYNCNLCTGTQCTCTAINTFRCMFSFMCRFPGLIIYVLAWCIIVMALTLFSLGWWCDASYHLLRQWYSTECNTYWWFHLNGGSLASCVWSSCPHLQHAINPEVISIYICHTQNQLS